MNNPADKLKQEARSILRKLDSDFENGDPKATGLLEGGMACEIKASKKSPGVHPQSTKEMTPYQVGVSAEGFAAALFARAGFHVSVQYGANQPGYDLIIERARKPHLISVKGSQDGGWGLTQSYLKNADYHGAVDEWVRKHGEGLIFCFVQFKDKRIEDMPNMYLATCREVANHLKKSGGGHGDTILHIEKTWKSGKRAGNAVRIPEHWRFTKQRVDELLK